MKLLITAGPTREPIDPVRYLTNRSSGKMGYALAQAAVDAGYDVTLVSGPVSIAPPPVALLVQVEKAQEMYHAVEAHIAKQDAAIFAAAVADYRPATAATQKIKKTESEMTLQLERTPDILGSARSEFGFKGILAGFAAETQNLITYAQDKLHRKGCDLIVANDVSAPGVGFESSENEVTLLLVGMPPRTLPKADKLDIAREILRTIETLHHGRVG